MKDGTSEKLMEIASRLIAERGFYGLTYGDVASEAGVSKGTLSYYYPNKQAILAAAAKRAFKIIGDSLLSWVDSVNAEDDPEVPLGRLCEALLGEPLRVFIAANGAAEPGGELEEAVDGAMSEWNVMIDVGSMRMRPEVALKMKRTLPAIIPFVTGLAALNADPDYAKEAFLALILGQ